MNATECPAAPLAIDPSTSCHTSIPDDPRVFSTSAAPISERTTARSSVGWLAVALTQLVVFGAAWIAWHWLDTPLYRVTNHIYNQTNWISGELQQIVLSLAMYGQALGIVVSLLLIALLDRKHRGRALVLGAMLLASGLASSSLKAIVGRERPLESHGATVLHGLQHGLAGSRNQSFPSGHTSTAFALSYGLTALYPQTGWFVWPLAVGVGINRVVTVRHFLSDVIVGGWLGFMMAALVWRLPTTRMLEHWGNRLLTLDRWRAWIPRWSADGLRSAAWSVVASPVFLFVVILAGYWMGNGEIALWDRDEPRFATATREMLARGDWIVPTFNDELRPDKPILIYWLMGIAYQLVGDGTFAARMASGLAVALASLVVYALGRSMFDRRVGLIAAWMLALAPMAVMEAKLATVDGLLLFLLCVCIASWWWMMTQPVARWAAVCFWTALALALLAKGPVALGVLATTGVAYGLLTRQWGWLGRMQWSWGVPLCLALVLPWCLLVYYKTDGQFLSLALGHHVVRRAMEPLEGHSGIPGYYVLSVLGLMAPWSWLLPWTMTQHGRRLLQDHRCAFLLAWGVGPLVLFELVRTKLLHYYLPAYPALVLLIASALVGRFADRPIGLTNWDPRVGKLAAWLMGLAGVVATVGLGLALPGALSPPAILAVGVICGAGSLAALLANRGKFSQSFAIMVAALVAGLFIADIQLLPRLTRQRVMVRVADRLRESYADSAVGTWLLREPSLVYNLGRCVPVVDPMRSEPMFRESLELARRHGRFVCPMNDDQMAWMRQDPALELQLAERVEPVLPGDRAVNLVWVSPSSRADELQRLQHRLAGELPNVPYVVITLEHESPPPGDSGGYRVNHAFRPSAWSERR